jgi:hypothetical protein
VGVGVVEVRPGMSPPRRPPQPEEPPPPDEPPLEPPPDEPGPVVGVVVTVVEGSVDVVVGGAEDVVGSAEPVGVIVAEPLGAAVSVEPASVVVAPLPPEPDRAALDGPADAVAPPVPCVEALSDALSDATVAALGEADLEAAAAPEADAAPVSTPPPDGERAAVVATDPLFDPKPPPPPPPLPLLVPPPPPPPPPPPVGAAAVVRDAASAVSRLKVTPARNPTAMTSRAMSVLVTTPTRGACCWSQSSSMKSSSITSTGSVAGSSGVSVMGVTPEGAASPSP